MNDLWFGVWFFGRVWGVRRGGRKEGGGGGGLVTTKKIRQIEVTERNLFY